MMGLRTHSGPDPLPRTPPPRASPRAWGHTGHTRSGRRAPERRCPGPGSRRRLRPRTAGPGVGRRGEGEACSGAPPGPPLSGPLRGPRPEVWGQAGPHPHPGSPGTSFNGLSPGPAPLWVTQRCPTPRAAPGSASAPPIPIAHQPRVPRGPGTWAWTPEPGSPGVTRHTPPTTPLGPAPRAPHQGSGSRVGRPSQPEHPQQVRGGRAGGEAQRQEGQAGQGRRTAQRRHSCRAGAAGRRRARGEGRWLLLQPSSGVTPPTATGHHVGPPWRPWGCRADSDGAPPAGREGGRV